MKKFCLILLFCLITMNIYSQAYPRLMESPSNQTPVLGQSIFAFTVNLGSNERSVILSIDDVKIGHYFNGETVELAVSDGQHIIRAYQMAWNVKANGWIENGDDRLTEKVNNGKMPVEIIRGPKLKESRAIPLFYNDTLPAAPAPAKTSKEYASKPGIEGAVARAGMVFVGELPRNSTVAVISISSPDVSLAAFSIDELEYQLVTAKQFTIVDRKTLDIIRTEQKFQLSGEISDQSAITIGNMLGANIVITGNITGAGNTQRLTLKALDVKTAQIVAMARESF